MAIAHNTTTSANTFASSLTYAHTTSGSDKLLIVSVLLKSGTVTVSNITHNGNSLTLLTSIGDVAFTLYVYYMVNPDTTGNVVVTLSASTAVTSIANSYTGVHQTTPLGAAASVTNSSGTSSSVVLSSANDELCFDTFANRNSDVPTQDSPQVLRGTQGGSSINDACSEESGASSVTMGWTWTNSTTYTQIGVPIKPVAVDGVTIPVLRRRQMMRNIA